MPRQIIDTETSRPAYVRRRAIGWVVWLIVILVIAIGIWLVVGHHPMQVAR